MYLCFWKVFLRKGITQCKKKGFAFSFICSSTEWTPLLSIHKHDRNPIIPCCILYVMLPHAVLHVNSARARLSLSLLLWMRLHLPSPSLESALIAVSSLIIPVFLQKAPKASSSQDRVREWWNKETKRKTTRWSKLRQAGRYSLIKGERWNVTVRLLYSMRSFAKTDPGGEGKLIHANLMWK